LNGPLNVLTISGLEKTVELTLVPTIISFENLDRLRVNNFLIPKID